MAEKKQVFDVILFDGNIDSLNFRYKVLNPYISQFIVICNEEQKNLFNDDNRFNIIDIDNTQKIGKKIVEMLTTHSSNFEDLIVFSKPNSIPDLRDISKLNVKFNFAPVCHKVYTYNFDYKKKYYEKGSVICKFSFLTYDLDFMGIFETELKNPSIDTSIKNGWTLENFSSSGIDVENTRYYCRFSNRMVKILYDDEEKPYFKDEVDFESIVLTKPKKFLITLISTDTSNYDTVFLVNVINSFPEKKYISVGAKYNLIDLYVPTEPLYLTQDYNSFKKKYIKNEMFRFISEEYYSEEDEVTLILNENDIQKFKVFEIKNPS